MLVASELQNFCIEELDALPTDSTKYRMVVVADRLYMSKKNGGWLEIYTNNNTANLPIISSGDASKVVEVKPDESGYILNGQSIKAWGIIQTHSPASIMNSYNVDSIDFSDGASCLVTLINPFLNDRYSVVAQVEGTTTAAIANVYRIDNYSFKIFAHRYDNLDLFQNCIINFIAVGEQ